MHLVRYVGPKGPLDSETSSSFRSVLSFFLENSLPRRQRAMSDMILLRAKELYCNRRQDLCSSWLKLLFLTYKCVIYFGHQPFAEGSEKCIWVAGCVMGNTCFEQEFRSRYKMSSQWQFHQGRILVFKHELKKWSIINN